MAISPNAKRYAAGGHRLIGAPVFGGGGRKAPPAPAPPWAGGRPVMQGNNGNHFGELLHRLGVGNAGGHVPIANGQGGHPIVHGGVGRDGPGINPFANGSQPGQAQSGYQGLGQIFQMLQQGITPQQLQNMTNGATGGNGYQIGGMHGAFSGLSPYAVHFLATSGLLQQAAPQMQDTTGLSGDDLFRANLMNQLSQGQAGQGSYQLHSGINQDQLAQMLGMTQGGGYAQGYNATGRVNPMNGQPFTR